MNVSLNSTEVIEVQKILKRQNLKVAIVFLVFTCLIGLGYKFLSIDTKYFIGMGLGNLFLIVFTVIKYYRTRKDLTNGIKVVQEMQIKFVEWFPTTTYHMEPEFKILYTQIKEFGISKGMLKEGVKVKLEYLPEGKQIIMFKILH